jgi:hypothetical protein
MSLGMILTTSGLINTSGLAALQLGRDLVRREHSAGYDKKGRLPLECGKE